MSIIYLHDLQQTNLKNMIPIKKTSKPFYLSNTIKHTYYFFIKKFQIHE